MIKYKYSVGRCQDYSFFLINLSESTRNKAIIGIWGTLILCGTKPIGCIVEVERDDKLILRPWLRMNHSVAFINFLVIFSCILPMRPTAFLRDDMSILKSVVVLIEFIYLKRNTMLFPQYEHRHSGCARISRKRATIKKSWSIWSQLSC